MKNKDILLTVCIIAKDNQDIIADCLDSVAFADEVLFIDTGSTDLTPEIAKKMGARVVKYAKGSYDAWRSKGLSLAKGKWIFYVDSDERVTEELKNEVLELVDDKRTAVKDCVAYAIPRKNFIFGKKFKYSGQYPDYQKRFFLKSKLKKWKGEVHEEPIFDGELGHLKYPLKHLKHDNLEDMVTKTNGWSEIEAKLMLDANHPNMNIPRFCAAMFREFWQSMIKKKGYKDGVEGIIYALYQVFSRFVSYAKLWEMQNKSNV